MKKSLLAACAAVLCLLPAARAQLSVSLKGTVEALSAPGCDPAATHRIRCTDVLLKSSTINLSAFNGRVVDLTGTAALTTGCTTIDVDAAVAAQYRTSQLAILGTRLGRPVTMTSFVPPGSTIFYVWSCGSGFLPLGQFGSLLIDPTEAVFVGTNLSIGIDLRTETIPNNPNLVGVTVWYQFGYLALLTGFEVGFLNPGCITIQQ